MVEFNLELIAESVGQSLEALGLVLEEELNAAIEGVAEAAYAKIIMGAQEKLHSTRADYLNSLSFHKLGPLDFIISLKDEGLVGALELGAPAYNLTEKLLRSTATVSAGPRMGEKWVQQGKNGGKYAQVPLQKRPYAKSSGSPELQQAMRKMTAFNAQGLKQKITKTFTDAAGKALSGKVAVGRSDISQLDKLTKYQHVAASGNVQSQYYTFRTISENGTPWMHPGFQGLHLFSETEKWIGEELKRVFASL